MIYFRMGNIWISLSDSMLQYTKNTKYTHTHTHTLSLSLSQNNTQDTKLQTQKSTCTTHIKNTKCEFQPNREPKVE